MGAAYSNAEMAAARKAAAETEREAILAILRSRLSELKASPHNSGGPISGGIGELGRAIRAIETRD